jgi:hypothetical protein
MRGERLRVVRGGSLTSDNLREELVALTTVPASLCFRSDAPPSIGNDHVRERERDGFDVCLF